jgi:hypothetical protein
MGERDYEEKASAFDLSVFGWAEASVDSHGEMKVRM